MSNELIVLVGFMGCGKTAVANELAALLDQTFIDLDAQIERIEGRSPAQIIREEGEQAFREKETAELRSILNRGERAVVALGGGAWTVSVNRESVRSVESIVIWLDTPFDICWQRIEQEGKSRPMAPSRAAAENRFSERIRFYSMADLHVPATTESPKQIAEHIAALLQQQSHT